MNNKYLICNINENLHGIKINDLSQIYFSQKITPIPLSEPEVRGVVEINGDIRTVIDLGICLYKKETSMDNPLSKRIVSIEGTKSCFLVDDVIEIVELEDEEIQEISIDNSNFNVAKYKDNVFSIVDIQDIIGKIKD